MKTSPEILAIGTLSSKGTRASRLESHRSNFVRKLLCFTLLGRKMFYYEAYRSAEKLKTNNIKGQKIVVLFARGRPNESNSNLVLNGFMEQLLNFENETMESQFMRDTFFFLIIPILNPDGVLVGNSKCSLSGQDLNRVWGMPDRYIHPEIYYAKKLLKHLKHSNDIIFFTEFHANLSRPSQSMFGNNIEDNRRLTREFPAFMGDYVTYFEINQCK